MRKQLFIEELIYRCEWNGNKMKAGDLKTIKGFKLGSKGFSPHLPRSNDIGEGFQI